MAKSIARVSGVALRPGVSRNGRLYEKSAIASAVKRAAERIAAGESPLTMLTHHDAGDSSTHIVGRVTALSVAEDGSARYEAEIADTAHGRTIATLVDPDGGTPFLRGVSIRGAWVGEVKRKQLDGRLVEYADDLELDGLDFTKNPGVPGAGVDTVTRSGPRESADGRALIFESVQEARVVITEDDTMEDDAAEKAKKPAAPPTPGASQYADPGYLDDKAKRYPVDTAAHAKSAWSFINQAKNAAQYTPAQLKRIKGRITKALQRFGVKVTAEHWLISPAVQVAEAVTESEMWPERPGSFCVNVDNGTVSISVSSCCIDPADLELVARKAMDGVCAALAAIDPDQDGDVDTEDDGVEADDTTEDDAVETAPPAPLAETGDPETPEPAAIPAAGQPNPQEEVPGMAEPTVTPAAGTTAAAAAVAPVAAPVEAAAPEEPTLTLSQVKDLFSSFSQALAPAAAPQLVGAGAPAEAAPAAAAPVTETAAPAAPVAPAAVQETEDQRLDRMVQERVTKAIQDHAAANGVQRKGLVETAPDVTSAAPGSDELPDGWPQKPLHTYTEAERKQYLRPHVEQAVMGGRSVYRQA